MMCMWKDVAAPIAKLSMVVDAVASAVNLRVMTSNAAHHCDSQLPVLFLEEGRERRRRTKVLVAARRLQRTGAVGGCEGGPCEPVSKLELGLACATWAAHRVGEAWGGGVCAKLTGTASAQGGGAFAHHKHAGTRPVTRGLY